MKELNRKKFKIKNKIKNKYIYSLYNTITENFPEYDFSYMNKNIKNLRITPFFFKDIINKKKCTVAYYDCIDNEIKYSRKYKKASLPHEFLHMASTIKLENGVILSGISQLIPSDEIIMIGKSLNEGYTQLLTERYFPESNLDSYKLEVLIALKLEEVIGKEEMEYLYFGADLNGLINKLLNYKTKDEILYFIDLVDFLENAYLKSELIPNIKKLKYNYIYIIDFLISIKTEQLKEEQNIYESKEMLKDYIDSFMVNLHVKGEGEKYKIIDQKILDTLYNKYSKKLDSFKAQKTYLK